MVRKFSITCDNYGFLIILFFYSLWYTYALCVNGDAFDAMCDVEAQLTSPNWMFPKLWLVSTFKEVMPLIYNILKQTAYFLVWLSLLKHSRRTHRVCYLEQRNLLRLISFFRWGKVRTILWNLMEYPETSKTAQVRPRLSEDDTKSGPW